MNVLNKLRVSTDDKFYSENYSCQNFLLGNNKKIIFSLFYKLYPQFN